MCKLRRQANRKGDTEMPIILDSLYINHWIREEQDRQEGIEIYFYSWTGIKCTSHVR